jgi:sec-independent protein translocase protein TatA
MLFGFLTPSPTAMLILMILAVLLFGQNLPEVARTFGKKFVDFRRSMKPIEDEIRSLTSNITSSTPILPSASYSKPEEATPDTSEQEEPTAPKFEPPPVGTAPKYEPPRSQ